MDPNQIIAIVAGIFLILCGIFCYKQFKIMKKEDGVSELPDLTPEQVQDLNNCYDGLGLTGIFLNILGVASILWGLLI